MNKKLLQKLGLYYVARKLQKIKDQASRALLEFKDHVPYRGALCVERLDTSDPNAKWEKVVEDHDIILDLGREQLATLYGGDDLVNTLPASMEWGDGGHVIANPSQAVPPEPTDPGLVNSLGLTKAFESHDNPSTTSVRFISTIDQGELNGELISEVILKSFGGTPLARKTFGALAKSSSFLFRFKWTIAFELLLCFMVGMEVSCA